MSRIPQSFIDDLLDRVDIVDIVNSRVPLKKAGKNYKACCPFHDEKTPSFTVAQDKQFYYCFGCGAGGNSLGFVMEFDRLDFRQAVEKLAGNAGLEVPKESHEESERAIQASQKKDSLYSVLEESDKFYRQQLRSHSAARTAIDYLKNRGLSGEIAARFGLGYAPPGWDNLLKNLGTSDERKALLDESGMVITKDDEDKQYDRFRQRIMFPIRDQRGRTIGFGGRVLDDGTPKYLNSPETPVFHKGRELYGLYEARKVLKEIPHLIMVEGYMDVIALAQYGINNCVATLGTALTENHLQKIFRYTSEIVFCFDGDEAGRRAAARALEVALPEMRDGVSARFLFLPDGEDPDTLVRKLGSEQFKQKVVRAQPLSDFLFEQLSTGIDTRSADGKARLSKIAAPQINRIPDGVFRQLMLAELSQRTGLRSEDLRNYVAHHATQTKRQPEPEPHPEEMGHLYQEPLQQGYTTARNKLKLPPLRFLTGLLINNAELAELVGQNDDLLQPIDNDATLFLKVLEVARKNPHYKPAHFIAYWTGIRGNSDETSDIKNLAALELLHPPRDTGRDDHREFSDALLHVRNKAFNNLPPDQQATLLVAREQLSESDIKRLNSIYLKLFADPTKTQLKLDIKQKLTGK